jgi:hypothetical protein
VMPVTPSFRVMSILRASAPRYPNTATYPMMLAGVGGTALPAGHQRAEAVILRQKYNSSIQEAGRNGHATGLSPCLLGAHTTIKAICMPSTGCQVPTSVWCYSEARNAQLDTTNLLSLAPWACPHVPVILHKGNEERSHKRDLLGAHHLRAANLLQANSAANTALHFIIARQQRGCCVSRCTGSRAPRSTRTARSRR